MNTRLCRTSSHVKKTTTKTVNLYCIRLVHFTYLNTDGQIVLLDRFKVQRMVHLDVGPRIAVVRSLLQIERVQLVRLCGRAGHKPIEYRRITLNARAARTCTEHFHRIVTNTTTAFVAMKMLTKNISEHRSSETRCLQTLLKDRFYHY